MRRGEARKLGGKYGKDVIFERMVSKGMALGKKQEAERPWLRAG